MNNSGRVGNISSGTGVSSSKSGDSSGSKSSNAGASRWADIGISSGMVSMKTKSVSVWVSSISSIAETGISKTGISVTSIENCGISLGLSLTFSNMDNSGRVGDVSSGTGVSSSKGWDGSRSKSSNASTGRWAYVSVSSGMGIGISMETVGIWVSGISGITETVSKTSISKSSIEKGGIGFSFSLTLGNMDDSGGVGDVSSGTSVSSGKGWDSGGGKTSNAGTGRGAHRGVSMGSKGISGISIGIRISGISEMSKASVSVGSIKESWIGFSLWFGNSNSCKTSDSQEFVHVF